MVGAAQKVEAEGVEQAASRLVRRTVVSSRDDQEEFGSCWFLQDSRNSVGDTLAPGCFAPVAVEVV